MANKTKKALTKAFIGIGKEKVKQPDGKTIEVDKFIILSEELAKFAGATYSTTPPADINITITKGALAGRKFTRSVSTAITGRAYKIGYVDGLKPAVQGKKRQAKIKWISLHVTKGVTLRTLLKAIRTKFNKKPVYFKTPDGVTTRFVFN
jgi:hypothetical protein